MLLSLIEPPDPPEFEAIQVIKSFRGDGRWILAIRLRRQDLLTPFSRLCSDLIEFLQTQAGEFDLAVAADVFGYICDLGQVFRGVRRALRPGGLFCFSVEAGTAEDFVLQTNLRFAHAEAYLRRLAQDHEFGLETIESQILRQDDGVDVVGQLVVLRRS